MQRYGRLLKVFTNWHSFLFFKWKWTNRCRPLRTRNGLTVVIPKESNFEFKDVFLHEAYGFQGVMDQLQEEATVVDIGANVGFFSLYALQNRPVSRCFSYEPLPANFEILRTQRNLNLKCRWQIFQNAVAGRDGVLQIYSSKAGLADAGAMLVPENSARGPNDGEVLKVEAVSLAHIFETHSIQRCDWLKMDCEGSEYDILYECPPEVLSRVQMISMELHPMDSEARNAPAICKFLKERGYRIFCADDSVVHAIRENGSSN
jgi:FkbM family methyltransferase